MAAAPLPGSAGYRRDIASHRPQRRGHPGPPQLAGRLSDRSTPLTPEGSSTSASGPTTSSMAFTAAESARHPLGRLTAGDITTLAQASLLVADRSVAPPRFDDAASRPTPGASLPGTRTSPRAGLAPASPPALTARLRHHSSFLSWRPSLWAHSAATSRMRSGGVALSRALARSDGFDFSGRAATGAEDDVIHVMA
jgi:hypothetical protein